VEIDLQSNDVPDDLSREIAVCLFRVLQEALQNAVKHSGSEQFEVKLYRSANDIHLRVSDSGVGFDSEVAMRGRGLGITSMRERLKLVDGQLSIDSKPQQGTTIHARAPLGTKKRAASQSSC